MNQYLSSIIFHKFFSLARLTIYTQICRNVKQEAIILYLMAQSTDNSFLSQSKIKQVSNLQHNNHDSQEILKKNTALMLKHLLKSKKTKRVTLEPIRSKFKRQSRASGENNDPNQINLKTDHSLNQQEIFLKRDKQTFFADFQEEKQKFVLKKMDNGLYDGDFLKGRRRGKGIFTWQNGGCYIGNWKNDLMQGFGQYTSSNGDLYEGSWKQGKKDGFGKQVYKATGQVYLGFFKNGQRCGYGRYTYQSKDSYLGYFAKNMRQGRGHYQFHNGDQLIGVFINNQIHGHGQFYWAANDLVYQGDFQNGKIQGQGLLVESQGKGRKVLFKNDRFLKNL